MGDSDGGFSDPPAPSTHTPSSAQVREDCWSEDATHTLVEEWGDRYVELNRGNLRQKDWQEVADAVNACHGHLWKARRTDIQCKNRIDTLKKKYKIEKARVSECNGRYKSQWPFFARLDSLIGSLYKPSPPLSASHRKTPLTLPPSPSAVPVGPRSKRPAAVDSSFFRRNFAVVAAAAAEERSSAGDGERSGPDWFGKLAEAIERLGKIYERVEVAKQIQMIELEKQRMKFAKDLEIQRMKLFMDSQIQLEKIKRAKRSSESGESFHRSFSTVCSKFQ
ncbi:sequence-specific DNA binding transcription factor [Actinidia rufa]|uniref:Sequence-specific DNA binding transcription factor n=1 Tax=Actinidia rufa TaxID=165716 RepID=A0A7J0DF73_9ERIC|nr:sequence-specific DNA binding transcription factor [Actinidia rufa]